MEQIIPIEECAKQRLQVLVYAYTLLVKNLMEEGVAREKVKSASSPYRKYYIKYWQGRISLYSDNIIRNNGKK
ncbi:MAG: hypothetical protein KKB35_00175 [Proteobacteria bacterium]|nr:hypothetical protein [Pseudomonadota bacterium]